MTKNWESLEHDFLRVKGAKKIGGFYIQRYRGLRDESRQCEDYNIYGERWCPLFSSLWGKKGSGLTTPHPEAVLLQKKTLSLCLRELLEGVTDILFLSWMFTCYLIPSLSYLQTS